MEKNKSARQPSVAPGKLPLPIYICCSAWCWNLYKHSINYQRIDKHQGGRALVAWMVLEAGTDNPCWY